MRSIAACQFSLSRFGGWRWSVVSLGVGVQAALLAWSASRWANLAGYDKAALVAVCLAAWALALSLARVKAVQLRWDGAAWSLRRTGPSEAEGVAGELSVCMDLGFWMLLKFKTQSARRTWGVTWLPVQRRGLEPQWHAFRCAAYSPRPGQVQGADDAVEH
jgi:hypothetical protein